MKNTIWILAVLLAATACGREETAPPSEQAPAADVAEDAAAEPEANAQEAPPAEDDVVEVVEESSGAVEDTEDKPIVLARADDAPARDWKFSEGRNYTRMVPAQLTVGGPDKVEVAEIFMYGCPHCFDLETYINQWAETRDPDVRFVRIPALFNPLAELHAKLYYTEEVLARNGKLQDQNAFRRMVFEEYHRRGNRMASPSSIQRLFTRAGVSEEDFKNTWNSFEVDQKLRVARDLTRRYNIVSVPMIVVNGKYRTDTTMAGGYPKLIELIDELTAREGVR